MNKHEPRFRINEFQSEESDYIVYWDPILSRFVRYFRDTMAEAIGRGAGV